MSGVTGGFSVSGSSYYGSVGGSVEVEGVEGDSDSRDSSSSNYEGSSSTHTFDPPPLSSSRSLT